MNLENVKKSLRPSKSEEVKVKHFCQKLQDALSQNGFKTKVMLGGSLAKGTNLKGQFDADIFVQFFQNGELSDNLEKSLKSLGYEYQRIKGSRDYFQIKNEFTYEIVPVLKVENYKQAQTVVDMSPLHVKYFKENIKGKQDDVRLAKAFCRAQGIYGAESHIKGFSGHVLNLLIIKYGSFEQLLKKASSWKPKVVIDLEKHHEDPLMALDKSKREGPLIIVDPVQKNRNAAAALSFESFEKFKSSAKKFLKSPSEDFFKEKIPSLKSPYLEIIPLEGKSDVVGSKILKVLEHLQRKLQKHEFEAQFTPYFNSKVLVDIKIEKEILKGDMILKGPPKEFSKHAREFKKLHKNAFEKQGILYAKKKRVFEDFRKLLKQELNSNYVSKRVKKITLK